MPEPPRPPTHPLAPFVAESRRLLTGEYLPKIRSALDHLDEGDLWWRPNPASNSVGNLLLHLAGNLRQWVVHGLGGRVDVRDRASEFSARGGLGVDDAFQRLRISVEEADRVLEELDPGRLNRPLTVQGLETTGLRALYHAVEHVSMHTGQILLLVKARTGRDLGFYRVDPSGDVVETCW